MFVELIAAVICLSGFRSLFPRNRLWHHLSFSCRPWVWPGQASVPGPSSNLLCWTRWQWWWTPWPAWWWITQIWPLWWAKWVACLMGILLHSLCRMMMMMLTRHLTTLAHRRLHQCLRVSQELLLRQMPIVPQVPAVPAVNVPHDESVHERLADALITRSATYLKNIGRNRLSDCLERLHGTLDATFTAECTRNGLLVLIWVMTRVKPGVKISDLRDST